MNRTIDLTDVFFCACMVLAVYGGYTVGKWFMAWRLRRQERKAFQAALARVAVKLAQHLAQPMEGAHGCYEESEHTRKLRQAYVDRRLMAAQAKDDQLQAEIDALVGPVREGDDR